MRRREFLTFAASAALTWPLASHAQQTDGVPRMGVLIGSLAEDDPAAQPEITALQQGLETLGWRDRDNIKIEYRWGAGKIERIRMLAKELIDLPVDLILSRSTPTTRAVLQQTGTIPVVFVQVTDPVGDGFVQSFARPGGNATGFTNIEAGMTGKWLELLSELVRDLKRVTLILNPETSPGGGPYFLRSLEAIAPSFGVEATAVPIHDIKQIEPAIAEVARVPGGALIVNPGAFLTGNMELIVRLATQYRVVAIYPFSSWAAAGGLLSYGTDTPDLFRRAASYVDRILKGEKPANLPVQAPTKFELVVNLKTAKALDLTIPEPVLLQADVVIE